MKTINTYYEDYSTLAGFVAANKGVLFADAPAVLVQVFSGVCDKKYLLRLAGEIRDLVPHAQVIGTTTAGEIMNGLVSGRKTVLSFTVFSHSAVKCVFLAKGRKSDHALGRALGERLGDTQAKAAILFATGLTVNASQLLKGLQATAPSLPVSGGCASDNSCMKRSFVLCGEQITDRGAVGAVLAGERLSVHRHWQLGWQPIGKEMTITRARDLRVYTIDGQPAYQAYRKYLGLDDIRNGNAAEYPLIASRHGVSIARIPVKTHEDGSLEFVADISEGEQVSFSFGHVGLILDQAGDLCRQIEARPAETIFIYSCSSRRGFLQELSDIKTMPLQAIAPTAGFFTYGEFYHAEDTNFVLNATMTLLVLSEGGKVRRGRSSPLPAGGQTGATDDILAGRNVAVLKALTHLVDTVTSELVSTNDKLRYASMHDPLTGLYNRAFFEQELARLAAANEAVGVIICDVDCLKIINDVLGHEFGDQVLKTAAGVIVKACRQPGDIVARIGGDEFAVLVPGVGPKQLAVVSGKITAIAAAASNGGREFSPQLSVGCALKNESLTMGEAFKQADANMYSVKLANSGPAQQRTYQNIIALAGGNCQTFERLSEMGKLRHERFAEHELVEASLRREIERTATLLGVSSRLNAVSSYDDVYGVICGECARIMNAKASYLHLYDADSDAFTLAASHGQTAADIPAPPPASFGDDGIATADDATGLVSVRLTNENQLVGILSYAAGDPSPALSRHMQVLLSGLADVVAVHIVKARLWQKNSGQLTAITAMYDNAQRLAHSLNMSNIARDVCRTCVEAFGASLAWVGKAEDDGRITVIGAYPEVEHPHKLVIRWDDTPAGQGPTGEAIRSGTPVIINDIRQDSRFDLWREAATRFGIASMAAFPLISRGKSFGALMVDCSQVNFFKDEKAYHIEAYGHQAAAALQNAKLYLEAERRAACLESLRDIDISITGNFKIGNTLNVVLDQALSRLMVDAADIFLFDEKTDMLTSVAAKGFGGKFADRSPISWGELPQSLSKLPAALKTFAIQPLAERRERIAARLGLAHCRAVPLVSKGKLQGLLEVFRREALPQDREWETFLDMLANQAAIAIDAATLFGDLKQSNAELREAYDSTIEGWSRILDLRDRETEGHSQRVAAMTLRLAAELGIGKDELVHIRRGALLHDIGKMGIPDSILLKPGPLNADEWAVMELHPVYAYEMLSPIKYLAPALDIPYAHHEKWDGTGYPRGLKGEDIPLAARIFAVVDVWDALGADRPYRRAWKNKAIMAHIRSLRGSHFDPAVVDLFFGMSQKR